VRERGLPLPGSGGPLDIPSAVLPRSKHAPMNVKTFEVCGAFSSRVFALHVCHPRHVFRNLLFRTTEQVEIVENALKYDVVGYWLRFSNSLAKYW
jgi:hypothetical protein